MSSIEDSNGFIFKQWERRISYYALIKLYEAQIRAFEITWRSTRSKGVRVALVTTFGDGWSSVMKEAGKQSLKYGGRKALGCMTGIACGYLGSASIILVTKSSKIIRGAKICHSIYSGGLDITELCASISVNMIEILVFGRPVILKEGEGLDLFSKGPSDPIEDLQKLMNNIFIKAQ